MTTQSSAMSDEELRRIPMINGLYCPACGHPTLILDNGGYIMCGLEGCPNPEYIEALKSRDQQIALAAQENGVAWVISLIDKIHMKAPAELDKEYKGLKNTIRDAYELHVGIDPAPRYPVNVTLKAQNKEK